MVAMRTWSEYDIAIDAVTSAPKAGRTGVIGEKTFLLRPIDKLPEPRKAIIAIHGHNANALYAEPGWNGGAHSQWLAHNGYTVLGIDAGGGKTWGNDAAVDGTTGAVRKAYDWLTNVYGIQGTKVGIMAWSMGGLTALNFIKRQPTFVSACQLWAPATNLDYFHNDGTLTAELETAYGGNYAGNAVGHKIYDEYPTWRDQCAIRIIHGDADTSAPLLHSQQFVAGVGQAQVTLTQLAGYTHTSLFSGVTIDSTKAFFDAGAWT